jgi:hypothetical protein|tara:strand:+ start:134 stop:427 length:294 start_codon:yes stop_codon:yes gene_type:complete
MAAHSGPGITGNVQTLNGTAAVIVAAGTQPRRVSIYNVDDANVFVGGDSGLTVANGFPVILSGGVFVINLPPSGLLWGIGDSSAEIRFLVQTGFNFV